MSFCFMLTSACKKSIPQINTSFNKPPSSIPFISINFEMDKKNHQLHSLDFCNRLFNFVTKIVSEHAFKIVKLGHPMHQNLAKPQNAGRAIHESDHKVHPRTQGVAPGFEDVKQSNYSSKNSVTFAKSCYYSNDHGQDGKELPTVQDNHASLGTRPQEEAPLPYSLVPQAKPAKIKKNDSIIRDRNEEENDKEDIN